MPDAGTLAAAPKHVIVALVVKFELNRRDGLRRVGFGLEKNTGEDGTESWKINFQLFERGKRTDPFTDPLVQLEVDVKMALNKKAEQMAKNGMTQSQADHAVGPAADDALSAQKGELPEEIAKDSIQKTLRK